MIDYDYTIGDYIFNSSLLTLNDIKLELMKSINNFYLVNLIINNDDLSSFNLNSGIITICPCIILKNNYLDILKCLDEEINDNYTFSFT